MSAHATAGILVGVVLLILGRKLFWVFVGAGGFIAGLNLAESVLAGTGSWTGLAVAVIAAIIGTVLAIFLQKVMVAVAGFLIGGYLTLEFLQAANVMAPQSGVWVAYIVGGIVGAILVLSLFDWALIVLSSLAGAVLITRGIHLVGASAGLLTLALLTVGIVLQAALLRRGRSAGETG